MTNPARKPLFSFGYQFDILVCLGLISDVFIHYNQVAGHPLGLWRFTVVLYEPVRLLGSLND
jgi:hypothetical protein